MKNKVSAIIPNWNGKHFLKTCLDSLLNQTLKDFRIIFVDNGSTDGSVEFVKKNYAQIEIITLDRNYGFAKANNLAIKKVLSEGTEYIALLNNDTRVERNWLNELVKTMSSEEMIGICAPKILRMDNPQILNSTGHTFIHGTIHDRGLGESDKGQYDKKLNVVGACAGACLYRKEMLEAIGLFDESFGTCYEDSELSWRAFKSGWKAKYVATAVVYHHCGGTTKSTKEIFQKMNKQNSRNMITTIKRYATLIQKLQVSFHWGKIAIRSEIGKWFVRNTVGGKPFIERLKKLWM
jgi:GT2 family glycosyltransferase